MQTATVHPPQIKPIKESESRISSDCKPGLWQPLVLTLAGITAGLALIAIGLAIAG